MLTRTLSHHPTPLQRRTEVIAPSSRFGVIIFTKFLLHDRPPCTLPDVLVRWYVGFCMSFPSRRPLLSFSASR